MPDLQAIIRDASNNVVVDISTRLGRVVEIFRYTGGSVVKSSDLLNQGQFWWTFTPEGDEIFGRPTASASGSSATFAGGTISGWIIWGIY